MEKEELEITEKIMAAEAVALEEEIIEIPEEEIIDRVTDLAAMTVDQGVMIIEAEATTIETITVILRRDINHFTY